MQAQETDRRMGAGSSFDSMLGFAVEATSPGGRPPSRDQRDDTARWPLWKTFMFLVAFCGAFWVGIIMAALHLLG